MITPEKFKVNSHRTNTLVHEIKLFRNRWAHQGDFSTRDVHRLLDSILILFDELQLDKSHPIYKRIFNSRVLTMRQILEKEENHFL